MLSQMVGSVRGIFALFAFVGLFFFMRFLMSPQMGCLSIGICALVAFVGFLSTVCQYMGLQAVEYGGSITTLITYMGFSPVCVFICFSISPA